jgi:hypothetical protein
MFTLPKGTMSESLNLFHFDILDAMRDCHSSSGCVRDLFKLMKESNFSWDMRERRASTHFAENLFWTLPCSWTRWPCAPDRLHARRQINKNAVLIGAKYAIRITPTIPKLGYDIAKPQCIAIGILSPLRGAAQMRISPFFKV